MLMLIINADDLGMDRLTTDRILDCFRHKRISNTTAMMFMGDSERSAEAAMSCHLPVGLHLNFTKPFDARYVTSTLRDYHNTLVKYFTGVKHARIIYNPFIRRHVDYCFKAQFEEFERLYGKPPTHIDGHHHVHLTANLMFSYLIPSATKIRRNVSFSKKKSFFSNWWRSLIDKIIKKRFQTTDLFLGLYSYVDAIDILSMIEKTNDCSVEFMVHPGLLPEYDFLISDRFAEIIQGAKMSSYDAL